MKSLWFIGPSLLLFACQHDNVTPKDEPISLVTPVSGNLITNGNFEAWNSPHLPIGWVVNDKYNYTNMITHSTHGQSGNSSVEMIRECAGVHTLEQRVDVEANSFYFASVHVSGKIFDYSYGGLTILSSDRDAIGTHLLTDTILDGFENTLRVKFYTEKETKISLVLGFLDGMNADIFFDNCTLFKTNRSSFFSSCDQALMNDCGVQAFNRQNFDLNVQKIVAHLDYLLIDGYKKFLRSKDSTYLFNSQKVREKVISKYEQCYIDSYFLESLHEPVTDIWKAYCQRSSLVASDVLDYINIATHEVYFVDNSGVGYHQFIEYWNPYSSSWVLIDPFFGIVYKVDGQFVGVERLKSALAEGRSLTEIIVRIPIDPFYYSFNDLMIGWSGRVDTQVYSDVKTTFPF